MKHEVRLQILACIFEIGTNSDLLRRLLDYLIQDAEQAYEAEAAIRIEIRFQNDEYILTTDGRDVARELCAEHMLSRVFGHTQTLALDRMADWIELHSACVERHGHRVLVTGPSGAGKTSIALRLMFAGGDLLADERVLYRAGTAMPYPRRFHIKQAGLRHHPELAALHLPYAGEDERYRVYSLSPHDLGRPWVLKPAPVDTVVYIEPNHGGQTRLCPIRRVDMSGLLMSQAYVPLSGRPDWIADIAGLVTRAACSVLRNGDPDEAAAAIGRLMSGAAPAQSD